MSPPPPIIIYILFPLFLQGFQPSMASLPQMYILEPEITRS
jgi:hypothetical protein